MQLFTWPWIIIIITPVYLAIVLSSNLSININFLREDNKNKLDVTFRFLLIRFKKSFFPETDPEKTAEFLPIKPEKEGETAKSAKDGLGAILSPGLKRYQEIVGIFLRYSSWHRLNAKLVIGLRDSFSTGLGSGIAWAAGGNLISFLERNLRFEKSRPALRVTPDFKGRGLNVDIEAIFSIRVVFLTLMLIKMLKILIIVMYSGLKKNRLRRYSTAKH